MNNTLNMSHTIMEVIMMVLNVFSQLNILSELLNQHLSNNTGSIEEYQQIKRIVQEISTKNNFTDEELLQFLPELYHYGLQGEIAQSLQEHVSTNKQNLISWTNAINEIKS